MSDLAIRVEGLGKRYRIGERERYYALRDLPGRLWTRALHAAARRLHRSQVRHSPAAIRQPSSEVWALKDVSFEVKRGEVVGIIGRNGAGKSTLLKVLSRITEPTEGRVEVHGRVGSLLEVGTGFHPELTGRENIYFNGAILGMKKAEIDRKFDEIVAFAEVEEFIDTPVKHYSSGMQMRLAFAVAAHLDPEILLVDEVLAVGDAAFQKKCLGKMGEVAGAGRTVLLVSHQLTQLRRLCQTCLWLDRGLVRDLGPASVVLAAYERAHIGPIMSLVHAPVDATPSDNSAIEFLEWQVGEKPYATPHVVQAFGPLVLAFHCRVRRPLGRCKQGITLWAQDGTILWGAEDTGFSLDIGDHTFTYVLSTLPLRPGSYLIQTRLCDADGNVHSHDWLPHLVVATQPFTHPVDHWGGVLNIPYEFKVINSTHP